MTNHNRAVAADFLRLFAVSVKTSLGQWPQSLEIFRYSIAPHLIASREQLPQEFAILFARREFAAAAQDQLLLDSPLEAMMRLLDVSVLVPAARRCVARAHPVMPQQPSITLGEFLASAGRFDGRRERIGAMLGWRPTQFPHGLL